MGKRTGNMHIGSFEIGTGRVFLVAELSANHNGSLETALETIRAAKASGADAVKLQTYTADTMTLNCDSDLFRIKQGTVWDGRTLYDLYREAYTPWEWHQALFDTAGEEGLLCFSTPFDKSSADFLETFDPPAYKIASFEITDIPLIDAVARKGKPVVISTGIARLEEIQLAVQTCKAAGNDRIILLKCTSSYPTPYRDVNLRTMPNLAQTFGVPAGLSDHTMGGEVAIAAAALGAVFVEKHFILDRNMGGPDSTFSMEPAEFKAMAQGIRNVEEALGTVTYDLDPGKEKSREFSRSLFVAEDIRAGEPFTETNLRSVRPGFGLAPKHLKEILGRTASRDLEKGTPLAWDMVGTVF